jgi:hypothetical protein
MDILATGFASGMPYRDKPTVVYRTFGRRRDPVAPVRPARQCPVSDRVAAPIDDSAADLHAS